MYRGIYTAPPNEKEGLQMIYLPERQVIRLDGWYNDRQGTMAAYDLPLGEFLRGLGISLEDCRMALEGASMQTIPSPAMATEHRPRTMEETPVPIAETPSSSRPMVPQK